MSDIEPSRQGAAAASDNASTNVDVMYGPGEHEDAAVSSLEKGETEQAKIWAILALASAVNRLADAQERR